MPKKSDKKNKLNFEGNTNREGEGSLYDKIMRENLLELFLPLVAEKLNFKFKSVEPLPDKQPTTILRETDACLLIKTDSVIEPEFILHLEFERNNNKGMVYRVGEYNGIQLRKYRLPIKHVVVYLGEKPPTMRTTLREEEVFKGFILVNVHNFSPQKWLKEKEPAKIIMAILGDYQKANAEIILKAIVSKLREVCETAVELKKFIEQLIIISRMRNLEELTIKISKAMPITIDIQKDFLYNLGKKETRLEARLEAQKEVDNLIKEINAKAKEAEAKIKAEAEARIKAEAEARIKAEAEARIKTEAEERAKIKEEKKESIKKMQAKTQLSDEEIMEFLHLDEVTFEQYVKEIKEEIKQKKNKIK